MYFLAACNMSEADEFSAFVWFLGYPVVLLDCWVILPYCWIPGLSCHVVWLLGYPAVFMFACCIVFTVVYSLTLWWICWHDVTWNMLELTLTLILPTASYRVSVCPSVLWCCVLGHLTCKIVSEMTYNVSSWMWNPTTLCPEKNGTNNILGITLTNIDRFS